MAPNFLIMQRKDKTEWYDFPTLLKFSKMLSFLPVAEAYGLIYPCPPDDNFSFVVRILLNPRELTILRLSSKKSLKYTWPELCKLESFL